jgi:hypothetical protein
MVERKCMVENVMTGVLTITFLRHFLTLTEGGVHCRRVLAELFKSGITDTKIITEIQKEHMGSAFTQPIVCTSYHVINKYSQYVLTCMRNDEMMTPTDPNVSAMMCKYTPVIHVNMKKRFLRNIPKMLSSPPFLSFLSCPCP